MMLMSLHMCGGIRRVLRDLPIKLDINEGALNISLIISALIGFGLLAQGVTGIRNCNNNTLGKAQRHLARGRKCLFFFFALYIIKIMVDIQLVSDIGDSLENHVDKLSILVQHHNEFNNQPHMAILYSNGTALFFPDGSRCLPTTYSSKTSVPAQKPNYQNTPPIDPVRPTSPEQEPAVNSEPRIQPVPIALKPNSQIDENSPSISFEPPKEELLPAPRALLQRDRNDRRTVKRHSHPMDFDQPIYYCESEDTVVLQIDMIRGHVSDMMVGMYVMSAVFNVVVMLCLCACIMCCNKRYHEACVSKDCCLYC